MVRCKHNLLAAKNHRRPSQHQHRPSLPQRREQIPAPAFKQRALVNEETLPGQHLPRAAAGVPFEEETTKEKPAQRRGKPAYGAMLLGVTGFMGGEREI